jgi:hypothetical protein
VTTYQGIAAVTQSVRYLVDASVRVVVPEATTTVESPQRQAAAARDAPRVTVFLLQVVPNPLARSDDLPSRAADGHAVASPRVALNLRYLLTFHGPAQVAQLLLGAVELALRERAYLDPGLVTDALAAHPDLAGSGLERQRPPVSLAPMPWDLEQFARMWTSFFQVPYTLATVYEASGLVLERPVPVLAAPPVREVRTGVSRLLPARGRT